MKEKIGFFKSMLSDERGSVSSKRVIGMLCGLFLCITMYHNSFSDEHVAPSPILVESVAMLGGACLGLTSLDKIFGKKQGIEESQEQPKES